MSRLKHLILTLLLLIGAATSAKADTYFPYPIVPDSISTLQGRCNYLADHFWDFCELSKAFSARAKMGEEFKVYLSILYNASQEKAESALRQLMKKLDKQPKDQLYLAKVAEGKIYADTAQEWVDQLYLPIAETVSANKRLDKAEKARFALQAELLRNSMVGSPIGSLPYTTREGGERNLLTDSAAVVVVFFNDPECSDCNMARIRLDADISTTQLIEEGRLKVVSVSLAEPDDIWQKAAETYPATWTVGANPDADLKIDLRFGTPDFYVLDNKHRIRFKHLNVDQVLDIARQLKKR